MTIEEQIQTLIDNAPQDGSTPQLVTAIAPVLRQLANQLRHLQYYIVQTLEQDWAITTLGNRLQPDLEKNVVYAFASLKDVANGPYPMQDPSMIALPVPTIQILFQMMTIEAIHSTIFFETPGNVMTGTEIQREEVARLIQSHLYDQPQSSVPPDIA